MAATSSSRDTHIRKRPYQPSITSYFHHSARDGNTFNSARPLSPLSPPLPAETQASLLSVGMRVRKSVPEGYKTHETLGSAGFPFTSTAPPVHTAREGYSVANTRELTPFCGLHKTGGWAAQEVPSSSAPAVMRGSGVFGEGEMEVPGLSMSQDTLLSTQGSFASSGAGEAASRKRTYEEETEDEIDAFFDEIKTEEAEERQMVQDDRRIARMKRTSDKPRLGGPVRIVGEDDFEEAAFLAPMDVDEA